LSKNTRLSEAFFSLSSRRLRSNLKLTKPQARIDRIFQTLRREICLLDYAPGEILREQDLADRFTVSRSPIRNVLSLLQADGLVESRQGVGTTVTMLNYPELLDVYYVRARLAEAIGDSYPVLPGPEVIDVLDELSRLCDWLLDKRDTRAFAEVNLYVHSCVLSVVRNQPMYDLMDRLFYQTARVWMRLLEDVSWQSAIRDFRNEIEELRDAMIREDLRAVGYIRTIYISKSMALIRKVVAEETEAEDPSLGK
jgi:DNA-binding GntR family transcriptional regulator